ncbi:MAG: ribonuclease HII [Vicinamibacteria bacterium]|nr:ribonuclease HII [Vicinamibacteria bacterium]
MLGADDRSAREPDGARAGENQRAVPRIAHEPGSSKRRPVVYQGRILSCTRANEEQAHQEGYSVVAGVDEVGRGALCGPVMVGAVVLGEEFDAQGVDDSKRLTSRQRTIVAERIRCGCRAWSLGRAEAAEIDAHGIVRAIRLALQRAIAALRPRPDLLLVDGYRVVDVGIDQRELVKGDARSVSIAAASIVAKVARDELMDEFDVYFPGYGMARNKGYGTVSHMDGLRRLGPSPCHRRSFGRQMRLFDGVG